MSGTRGVAESLALFAALVARRFGMIPQCERGRDNTLSQVWRLWLTAPLCALMLSLLLAADDPTVAPKVAFPFKDGDRVAWVGSSSTAIGIWPKTMEFLLRTRHPDVKLEFKRFTTGGGTFATGTQKLDQWLGDYKPTVVLFNYGSNDAGAGVKGFPQFKENIEKCVDKVKA